MQQRNSNENTVCCVLLRKEHSALLKVVDGAMLLLDSKGYHGVHAHMIGTRETAAQQWCVLSIESST
jgi:hypothetical protein